MLFSLEGLRIASFGFNGKPAPNRIPSKDTPYGWQGLQKRFALLTGTSDRLCGGAVRS